MTEPINLTTFNSKNISIYKIITKKNFGLIHVYFLYTVFRVTYITLFSKGYMTTKLKIAVGEGWGILSVGRVQLEINLGRAGGKNVCIVLKSEITAG